MYDIIEGSRMQDKFEKIGKSILYHGKINNRIYLMKLSPEDVPAVINKMDELADGYGYTKIFGKIQSNFLPDFIINNYRIEAYVPRFYKYKQDCLFVSKYYDKKRSQIPKNDLTTFYEILNSTERSKKLRYKHSLKYLLERLSPKDSSSISEVFNKVFKTYPFPIHDPDYIKKTMKVDKTQYFGIKDGKKLIGVSSAEVDIINGNAEMTDFAVLPEYRGKNLAFRLLVTMEQAMKYANIKTVYTIARLKEPGMCKTFLKTGYKYTGTLANNTNISGEIESMNIFYKHL